MDSQLVLGLAGGLSLAMFCLIIGMLVKMWRGGAVEGPSRAFRPVEVRPLLRMFSTTDAAFLETQPGYRPEIWKELRSRRAAICKGYLRRVENEFFELHRTLRLLVLTSEIDRPEISTLMMREASRFRLSLAKARFRLMLYSLGIETRPLTDLVEPLEKMRDLLAEMRATHPALQAAGV